MSKLNKKLILVGSNAKNCDKIVEVASQLTTSKFSEIEIFISRKHIPIIESIIPNYVIVKPLVHETLGFKDIGFICNAAKNSSAIAFTEDLGQDIDTIKSINAILNETHIPCIVDNINIISNAKIHHAGSLILILEEHYLDKNLAAFYGEIEMKNFAIEHHLTLVSLGSKISITDGLSFNMFIKNPRHVNINIMLFEMVNNSPSFEAAIKAFNT